MATAVLCAQGAASRVLIWYVQGAIRFDTWDVSARMRWGSFARIRAGLEHRAGCACRRDHAVHRPQMHETSSHAEQQYEVLVGESTQSTRRYPDPS